MSFIAANKVYTSTNKTTVYTSTNKTTIVWIETELFFFLPWVDASHVFVRALAQGCFYSHISTGTFSEGADHVAGQLHGDKECPFSGVTKSGRVWRKVPESGAPSVTITMGSVSSTTVLIFIALLVYKIRKWLDQRSVGHLDATLNCQSIRKWGIVFYTSLCFTWVESMSTTLATALIPGETKVSNITN